MINMMIDDNDSNCWHHAMNDAIDNNVKKIILVAAAALIDEDGRVLIAQRPDNTESMPSLWEFPGGKIENNETPEIAIIRELHEELGIETKQSCLAPIAFASHGYQHFHLLMPLFAIRQWRGNPECRYHQKLKWARPNRIADYSLPDATYPLVALLRDFLA